MWRQPRLRSTTTPVRGHVGTRRESWWRRVPGVRRHPVARWDRLTGLRERSQPHDGDAGGSGRVTPGVMGKDMRRFVPNGMAKADRGQSHRCGRRWCHRSRSSHFRDGRNGHVTPEVRLYSSVWRYVARSRSVRDDQGTGVRHAVVDDGAKDIAGQVVRFQDR